MVVNGSYVRLSGFYFFYFALLGAMVPYWSLYLESLSFDPLTIGVLMAMLQASRIVAPNLWGWLADRTGQRVRIVRMGALVTCVVFSAIFWQQEAVGMALVMLGFSFFWNAVLPQFEVITMQSLGEQRDRYSQIRLWGSIGFVFTVAGVGALLDFVSITWLPALMLVLMIAIWLNTLLIPDQPVQSAEGGNESSFTKELFRPQVIVFFIVCFLVQLGHGPYYTFYSVLMQEIGFSRTEIGLLWALGVVAEVIVFMIMHRLIGFFGLRHLLLLGLLLCVVRWVLVALVPDSLPVMLFSQLLHAATFGFIHAVGIALVHQYFSTGSQGQGQAMFSSFGFGAGGTLGALMAGWIWDGYGAAPAFYAAAAFSAVAIVLALIWIRPEKLQQNAG